MNADSQRSLWSHRRLDVVRLYVLEDWTVEQLMKQEMEAAKEGPVRPLTFVIM